MKIRKRKQIQHQFGNQMGDIRHSFAIGTSIRLSTWTTRFRSRLWSLLADDYRMQDIEELRSALSGG